MRSVLLVAQIAPPSELVAARRVAGFSKYLARLGHRVAVLTSRVSGEGEIEDAEQVVRTNDLLLTRLNWRRGHFAALSGQGGGDGYAPPSRLERVVVPDLAAVTWLPFALQAALRLARAKRFDCVVTSSPPASAHLVGLALKRRGLCWIADFRDGWTFESQQPPWPLGLQRRIDAGLEHRVARRADALVAVTEPIAADLRDRFGARVEVITNGFDPEDEGREAEGLLDDSRHSLVHTGRMAAARSSPKALLEALRRLRHDEPELAARLEVVFAGPHSAEERDLLAAADLDGLVRTVGALPRSGALSLQRQADSLLIVTEGARRTSVATGKLFEYLAAGRPVLVLGEETEAARIVEAEGAGLATSATDPASIAAALRRLLTEPLTGAETEARARYAYPELATRLADLIASVCG
jgi:glycosyltransferase involved in cell wall biosynthesis